MRRLGILLLVLVVVLGGEAGPLSSSSVAQVAEPTIRLAGHVPAALAQATRAGAANRPRAASSESDDALSLTLVLNRADEAGFQRYLKDVYDPKSPAFRRFLSQPELTQRFGPSQEAYDAVLGWLRSQGFSLSEGSANRLTLTVNSTRAVAERAFGVQIDDYQLGERRFRTNAQEPALPASIAPYVQAVVGLSDLAQPRSVFEGVKHCAEQKPTDPLAQAYANFVCSLVKAYILTLYNLVCTVTFYRGPCSPLEPPAPPPPGRSRSLLAATNRTGAAAQSGYDGQGQKVGLVQFDSFRLSDVSDYLALMGLPPAMINQVSEVKVNGGSPLGPDQTEVLLDIDTILSIAPGAQVVAYNGPFTGGGSFQAVFNAMLNDNVSVISNSWAYCEDQTTLADVQSIDAILQNAAAAGISVFNAAGDLGSTCLNGSPNTVHVPASAPHGTAVGGTTLKVGPGFTYGGEEWWSDGASGGGFGVSRFFPRPAYQNAFTSSPMRSVPDVASNADPASGVLICQADAGGCPTGLLYGGTSFAAPQWAGFTALLNQAQGQRLGHLNPLIYPLANSGAFHTPASMGSDFAHVGLGSPNVSQLSLALRGQQPGAVNSTESTVAVFPSASVAADGTSEAAIVVELRDSAGYAISGRTVTLTPSAGSQAITAPPSAVTSVDNGAAVFTVKNSTIQDVTFTASVTDGPTLQETATVRFVSPPAVSGGITANPTTVQGNGVATSTITVTLQNALGQGASGKLVTLSQGEGHSVITGPTPLTTDANGQVIFTVTDKVAETVTYTATDVTDGNLPIPGSATVTFTDGTATCALNVPTAAPGFAVSTFVGGFQPLQIGPDCVGPVGLGFDQDGTFFASNRGDNHIYKFGPQGGTATAATRLTPNPFPAGDCLQQLTLSQDGQQLYAALQTCISGGGRVVQVDKSTGQVVRTVANATCVTSLAIDPLSGDLFGTHGCQTFPGGTSRPIFRIRNPTSTSPPPTVEEYVTLDGVGNQIQFAPDGTLYVALDRNVTTLGDEAIVKVTGTDGPTPPVLTPLLDLPHAFGVVPVPDPANPDSVPFLFVLRAPRGQPAPGDQITSGTLSRIDLTQVPPVVSDAFTGGSRGFTAIAGPDGCIYAAQVDRVMRVSAAGGACQAAPSDPDPRLELAPGLAAPNPAQGTTHTVTATLRNLATPAGTPVFFTVTGENPQTKMVRADAAGQASFTFTGIDDGNDVIVARAAVGQAEAQSNPARVTWAPGRHTTFLTLNQSAASGVTNGTSTLTAELTDLSADPSAPVAGATIVFDVNGRTCLATTNSSGVASCPVTLDLAGGYYTLQASFAGTDQLLPDSEQRGFSVTGPAPSSETPTPTPTATTTPEATATATPTPTVAPPLATKRCANGATSLGPKGKVTCTVTLTNAVAGGTLIGDLTTAPARSKTKCDNKNKPTGGLVCAKGKQAKPLKPAAAILCPPGRTCAAGSTFGVSLKGPKGTATTIVERITIRPPSGPQQEALISPSGP